MDISVIIVNFNTMDLLDKCLKSVFENIRGIQFEVIVVDNNSADGSCEMVKAKYPSVMLIRNKENTGFGKANNQAAKIALGKYLLLINSDIEILKEGINGIFEFAQKTPDAGITGGKIYFPDGNLQYSCRRFPTALSSFFDNTSVLVKNINPLANHIQMKKFDHNSIKKVDWVSGAYMLIKKEISDKMGFFDETLFMYAEDVDLCMRFKKAGYSVYYYPASTILHHHGASAKKTRVKSIIYSFSGSSYFLKKYYGGFRSESFKLSVLVSWKILHIIFKLVYSVTRDERAEKKSILFYELLKEYKNK